jgi:hypothetical protein
MDYSIVQPSDGRKGGIIMFWKKEIKIHQIFACPNYIDVKIDEGLNKVWRFTGMYGEFKWAEKYKTWDRIRGIYSQNTLPWLIMGDLNEILYIHEKEGGRIRPERFRKAFHDTLDDCELDDIGYIGDPFTWHRGSMRERLDRGLANHSWNMLHDKAAIVHLQYNHSDHRPLLLDTEFYAAPPNHIIQTPKCFEAKWLKEPGFGDIVKEQWLAARENAIDVHESLKSMHDGLHDWDSRVLKRPKKAIRKAQFELEELMRGPISPESDQKKHQIAKLIEKLLEQEEIKWCQRSRANWLQNGDKNTGFFHIFAST